MIMGSGSQRLPGFLSRRPFLRRCGDALAGASLTIAVQKPGTRAASQKPAEPRMDAPPKQRG